MDAHPSPQQLRQRLELVLYQFVLRIARDAALGRFHMRSVVQCPAVELERIPERARLRSVQLQRQQHTVRRPMQLPPQRGCTRESISSAADDPSAAVVLDVLAERNANL